MDVHLIQNVQNVIHSIRFILTQNYAIILLALGITVLNSFLKLSKIKVTIDMDILITDLCPTQRVSCIVSNRSLRKYLGITVCNPL